MNRLGSNAAFLQRVKTFKEVNMNFLATESSAFHLDMPRCLPALFSTRPDNAVMEEVVHKLVSLCVTLNEYPHVRYNQNSVLGARIATLVQDALNVRTTVGGTDIPCVSFSHDTPTHVTRVRHRSLWRGRRTGGTTGSRATRSETAPRCSSWTGPRTP